MRYQAFILVCILFISAYIFKESAVSSREASRDGRAVISAVVGGKTGVSASMSVDSREMRSSAVVPQAVSSAREASLPAQTSEVMEKAAIKNEKILPEQCRIEAHIVLARILGEGKTVLEKNIRSRWPIASVTKLMTALVTLDEIPLSQTGEITKEIREKVGDFFTLAVGEKYAAQDLLRAMMISSSNDAAYALAHIMGEEEFIRKMNLKAQALLMTQTAFFEPSGLSYLNQSTAYDLSLLLQYIYQERPIIFEMSRQKSMTARDIVSGRNKILSNTNIFSGKDNFFGGKTGYIDESQGNLVTLFRKNGKIISIIVLGSADRFTETEKIFSCVE